MPQESILIAEDDSAISGAIRQILEHEGYSVLEASDGEAALRIVHEKNPNLVLLDISMPKLNGYQVCQKIKEDIALQHLPVIIITVLGENQAKLRGLNIGADDYIVKPFNYEELIARVRTAIRRVRTDINANPLTYLPGNNAIAKITLAHIEQGRSFALLYVDLNDFKAYNDWYGFVKGDEAILATSRILSSVMESFHGFLGHVGGDDFVILTDMDSAEPLCKQIIERFNARVREFYSPEDRVRGYIETKDRKGQIQRYPFLTIAIGVVISQNGRLNSLGEIGKISAEVKRKAKMSEGSSYFIDRRG